jgi:hypothetical protein
MPRLKSIIRFSELQGEFLESLSRRRGLSRQLSERVSILLASRSGAGSQSIATDLRTSKTTVVLWRNRWIAAQDHLDALESGDGGVKKLHEAMLCALSDLPRSGRPPTFSPEQRELLVAMASGAPREHGVEREDWSNGALAEAASENKVADSISPSTVRRILKK